MVNFVIYILIIKILYMPCEETAEPWLMLQIKRNTKCVNTRDLQLCLEKANLFVYVCQSTLYITITCVFTNAQKTKLKPLNFSLNTDTASHNVFSKIKVFKNFQLGSTEYKLSNILVPYLITITIFVIFQPIALAPLFNMFSIKIVGSLELFH